jgi:hypothetical protein
MRRHRVDDGLDAVDLLLVHVVGGFLQIPANGPMLGSIPIRLLIDPIFFTCRNWSRKSSSEKPSPVRALVAISCAFFLSICARRAR